MVDIRQFLNDLMAIKDMEEMKLIVATRDPTITLKSKLDTHQRGVAAALREQARGTAMLGELVRDPPCPIFLWSYETFQLLKGARHSQYAYVVPRFV